MSRKGLLILGLSTSTYRKQLGEGSSSFLTHLVSREMNRKGSIISSNTLDSNMHVGDRTTIKDSKHFVHVVCASVLT